MLTSVWLYSMRCIYTLTCQPGFDEYFHYWDGGHRVQRLDPVLLVRETCTELALPELVTLDLPVYYKM